MKTVFQFLLLFFAISLSAQGNKYEEWYFNTSDSLRIYVKESLSKSTDTVIVLHGGFGANHDYMLDATKNLEKDFHFVYFDQRGSLMSEPSAKEKSLTFDKNVEDIFTLMQELGIKKAKFFCHSMGTLVGMEFLRKHPEMVKNMVLVSAIAPFSEKENPKNERLADQVKYLMNRPEVQNLLKPLEEKKNPTAREKTQIWRIKFASVNTFQIEKSITNIKGGMAYYNQRVGNIMPKTVNWKFDYRDILNSNGKVTVIGGAYDFIDFRGEKYREQIKNYPNIDFRLIENSGHNIWNDEPEIFRKELKRALSK